MKNLTEPIHPGEILADELEVIGMTTAALAVRIRVPKNCLYEIMPRTVRKHCDHESRQAKGKTPCPVGLWSEIFHFRALLILGAGHNQGSTTELCS